MGILAPGAILAGCNIVAPVAYFIHGPEKTPKKFQLDKTKTTVILIDDRANNVPRRALRVTIGEEAEKILLKEKAVKDMVSAQSAMAAAGSDRSEKPTSIAEIGEAIKAQVVIYATVDSFTLSPDGATYAPTAKLRVRVVDVVQDARLWPEDPHGHTLVVRVPAKAQSVPSGTSARYQAEDELAKQTGLELAELFFDHVANKNLKVPD